MMTTSSLSPGLGGAAAFFGGALGGRACGLACGCGSLGAAPGPCLAPCAGFLWAPGMAGLCIPRVFFIFSLNASSLLFASPGEGLAPPAWGPWGRALPCWGRGPPAPCWGRGPPAPGFNSWAGDFTCKPGPWGRGPLPSPTLVMLR